MEKLTDKNILITGGTTGIGKACAIKLNNLGANILIFGRHENELNETLSELQKSPGKVFGAVADASTEQGVKKVFDEVDSKLKGIDILINNAGVGGGSILSEQYGDWKYLLETNTLGYIGFAKLALERMLNQGSGHIVNIGSLSADTKDAGSEVYVASKAAVQAFTEALRKAVNDKGIKVTLVEPGSVGTEMPSEDEEGKKKLIEQNKMLESEDIAEVVYFCLTRATRVDIVDVKVKPLMQLI